MLDRFISKKTKLKFDLLTVSLLNALLITLLFFLLVSLIIRGSLKDNLFSVFKVSIVSLFFSIIFLLSVKKKTRRFGMVIFLLFLLLALSGHKLFQSGVQKKVKLVIQAGKTNDNNLLQEQLEELLLMPGYIGKEDLCLMHYELIGIYLNNKEWKKAFDQSFKLCKLGRDIQSIALDLSSKGRFFQGYCLQQQGNIPEAVEKYLQVLKSYPDNDLLHYYLAAIFTRENQLDQAIKHVQAAIKLSPENTDYIFLLGSLYIYKAEFAKAVEQFREILEVDPSNKNALFSLCNMYTTNYDDKSEALPLSFEVVKKYPFDSSAHNMLARAFLLNKKYSQAFWEYKIAIFLNQKDRILKEEFKNAITVIDYYEKKNTAKK